jgi:nucleoside-diphosphate-sugar epimerase
MARAIVTGSGGFIGRHLVRRLKENGWEVKEVDVKQGSDASQLATYREYYDFVFHLAADLKQPSERTIDAARGVASYALAMGSWVVYTSSCAAAYPGYYGAQKLYCEALFDHVVKHYSCLRLFNVYGKGGHSVVDMFKEGPNALIYGSGTAKRDYVSIDDVVDALLVAAYHKYSRRIDVGTGVGTSVNELAELFNLSPLHVEGESLLSNQFPEVVAKLDPRFPWYPRHKIIDYV